MEIPRTLVVTNSFPPRVGGIQRTVHSLLGELPPERVSVFAPMSEGWDAFDAQQRYTVHREPGELLWPTPSIRRSLDEVIRRTSSDVVVFGDAMPLAMLGPRLSRLGTPYLVLAHGFDYWLSLAPGAHSSYRYMTSRASGVLVCSAFIARVVRTAIRKGVPVSVLYPGADTERFRPHLPIEAIRRRHGVAERPLVVCVSRLIPRKGQDVLIRSMETIRRRVPEACLMIVGDGPYRKKLDAMSLEAPAGSVVFAGEVSEEELPLYYAAGDVFAMPCRTRLGGLEVEGWGNVFLEAAACGRPVVVGNSGGAREALVDGVTGLLVDGDQTGAVAEAVSGLLADPGRAAAMGKAGRVRVEGSFTWSRVAEVFARRLREAAAGGPDAR